MMYGGRVNYWWPTLWGRSQDTSWILLYFWNVFMWYEVTHTIKYHYDSHDILNTILTCCIWLKSSTSESESFESSDRSIEVNSASIKNCWARFNDTTQTINKVKFTKMLKRKMNPIQMQHWSKMEIQLTMAKKNRKLKWGQTHLHKFTEAQTNVTQFHNRSQ